MGMGRPLAALVLTDQERDTLTRWSRRRKTSQALALRCRIVLHCAQGLSNQAVAAKLKVCGATVGKWRRRFVEHRLDGLSDVELKWTPLPNATRYRVHLTARKETPSPKSVMFLVVDVESPRMRFIDLSDQNQAEVRDNLISGRTGAWRVDAYGADSKCIGTTLKEMRFLVAGELPKESAGSSSF